MINKYNKAPGLSLVPFRLIKGKRRLDAEFVDVESRLALVREQQRLLEHKNAGCHINSRDSRTLENLNDEER
jgi:LMBR1 domain-containing protein 1